MTNYLITNFTRPPPENPSIAYHQDTDSQQNNENFIRYLFSSPQPCYSRFSFILGWYIFTFFTLSARNFLHPNRAGNNFSATFPTTIAHNLCKIFTFTHSNWIDRDFAEPNRTNSWPPASQHTTDSRDKFSSRGRRQSPNVSRSRLSGPSAGHSIKTRAPHDRRPTTGLLAKSCQLFFRRGKSTTASFSPCSLYLADKDIEFWWTPLPYLACMGILNTHAQTSGGHSLWRLVIRVTRYLYEISC